MLLAHQRFLSLFFLLYSHATKKLSVPPLSSDYCVCLEGEGMRSNIHQTIFGFQVIDLYLSLCQGRSHEGAQGVLSIPSWEKGTPCELRRSEEIGDPMYI